LDYYWVLILDYSLFGRISWIIGFLEPGLRPTFSNGGSFKGAYKEGVIPSANNQGSPKEHYLVGFFCQFLNPIS